MDFNHVQSEVNLYFLREIQAMSIPFYVIINQIDKHNENELSFNEYERSIKETFSQWNVVTEGIFYTSIIIIDAHHDQLVEIKETVANIIIENLKNESQVD